MAWISRLNHQTNAPHDATEHSEVQSIKEALALYRGVTCKKRNAEAFWTDERVAVDIF